MPTTVAPLLSFGASGQIAKTMVYSSWKGRPYTRRYTIPAYRDTTETQLTRNAFKWLQAVYKVAPPLVTEVWDAYAKGLVMTARNGWTKQNLPILRPVTTLDNFVMSPGALGGLPPASMTPTPGSGTITVAVVAPTTVPQGWTVYSAIAACIKEQDPQSAEEYVITAGEDTTSTYSIALSGLDAVEYQVFAWLKWTRPDGSYAYSPALQSQSTPS